jgi:hypothetical protein
LLRDASKVFAKIGKGIGKTQGISSLQFLPRARLSLTTAEEQFVHVFAAVCVLCAVALAGPASTPSNGFSLSDTDEVRIGKALAEKFIQLEGTQPTPQTIKIEAYLQTVRRPISGTRAA